MAESSWPTPANGRVVDDVQYEKVGLGLGPVAGVLGDFTSPQLVYGDSSGMQIKIAADRYAVIGGHIWWSGSTIFTKAIGSNSSGSTRTDLVVVRLSRTTWAATVVVIAGTPGAGAPAPTQNTGTTGSFDLPLATVTVASGAATITSGNVAYVGPHLAPDGSGYRSPSAAALTHIPLKLNGMTALALESGVMTLRRYEGAQGWLVWPPVPVQVQETTSFNFSSTSFAAGSPACQTTFVGPPHGRIRVEIAAHLTASNVNEQALLSYEIRLTNSAGAVVVAAAEANGVLMHDTGNVQAGAAVIHTGLISGQTYFIRTMHQASASAACACYLRRLIVTPLPS